MIGRVWVGLVMVLLAAVGLLVGWQIEENGDNAAVLAVLSALAVAAGFLLAASARGEVAVRATGGLLFVAGLAVAITDHEVWWWLPSNWQTPVSLAALAISLVGLGVLLLAYGFSRAGLSGALGLLALACLALVLLPYIGSDEQSVLRAFATALGAIALTTGVSAATLRTRVDRRVMTAVVAVVGAAVTGYTGYDSYGHTPPGGYHAAVIAATITGAVASLAIGVAVCWPNVAGGLLRKDSITGRAAGPDTVVPPTPPPLAPAEPVTTPPTPAVSAAEPSSTTAASAASAAETASHTRDRLQTASLAVGLIIGLITIAKELIAAALAIIG